MKAFGDLFEAFSGKSQAVGTQQQSLSWRPWLPAGQEGYKRSCAAATSLVLLC